MRHNVIITLHFSPLLPDVQGILWPPVDCLTKGLDDMQYDCTLCALCHLRTIDPMDCIITGATNLLELSPDKNKYHCAF